ncbi:MAG: RHS repeat-associated core domain-containing protein, partial [Candidatus Omnitrophica bacterium]|nr:RHS repeat-associated core domain-containing protein [Candidatus Omnitrophota bacterium]
QFSTLEYGKGYQIFIKEQTPVSLTISGTYPLTKSVALKAGYNLITCPKIKETPVEQALLPLKLGVDYSKILHYNKDTSLFEIYDANSKEFSTLAPGESYYLSCVKDVTWAINNAAPVTTFTYDGDGGRVKKTIGTTTTTYIGSLYEVESAGAVRKHIFAGANRVCSIEGTEAHYFHSDHLGSSNVISYQNLINTGDPKNGTQEGFTEFTPYGSTFKQTGTYDPRHKFTGKELDASTGLYYYGARYYDAELGRFITADTIVQAPYDPQSLNRYAYCRNNPINYVDPTGHAFFLVALAIAGIKALAAYAVAHPILTAIAAASLVYGTYNGGASAAKAGYNVFQGAAIGFGSGVLGLCAGIGVGGVLGTGFWAGFGGAISGAFTSALTGTLGHGLSAGLNFGKALSFAGQAAAINAAMAAVTHTVSYGATQGLQALKASRVQTAATGGKTPVGQQGQGSTANSLNVNQGEAASNTQAISSRGTKDSIDLGVIKVTPLKEGQTVYRQGTFADESTGWEGNLVKGKQWAIDNPASTPNFAQKYGLPAENSGNPDWIAGGKVVGEYGLRPAPASHNNPANPGGRTEVNSNDVQLDWFHMRD